MPHPICNPRKIESCHVMPKYDPLILVALLKRLSQAVDYCRFVAAQTPVLQRLVNESAQQDFPGVRAQGFSSVFDSVPGPTARRRAAARLQVKTTNRRTTFKVN